MTLSNGTALVAVTFSCDARPVLVARSEACAAGKRPRSPGRKASGELSPFKPVCSQRRGPGDLAYDSAVKLRSGVRHADVTTNRLDVPGLR